MLCFPGLHGTRAPAAAAMAMTEMAAGATEGAPAAAPTDAAGTTRAPIAVTEKAAGAMGSGDIDGAPSKEDKASLIAQAASVVVKPS